MSSSRSIRGPRKQARAGWPATQAPPHRWALPEDEFEHRDSMITKAEVRALVLARLGPAPGRTIWDVGAGSGSVAVECARFGAYVIAVEADPAQCARIRQNATHHGVYLRVHQGRAPEALTGLPPADAVFLGGGDRAVLEAAVRACNPGRVVVTLAAVQRVGETSDLLTDLGYRPAGVQLQASRLAPLPERRPPPRRREPRLRPQRRKTMIGLISVTKAGRTAAERLAAQWPDARQYDEPASTALPKAFAECDAIVCFLAVGATVRLIAPLLRGKGADPGVVCVDEALRYAVPVLGAHGGGGNALAGRVAQVLGAEPVITTASDAAGGVALDEFGADLDFKLEPGSDLAAVGTAILSGERVTFTADTEWPLPAAAPERRAHRPAGTRHTRHRGDRPERHFYRTGRGLPPPVTACRRGREPRRPRRRDRPAHRRLAG